MEKYMKRSLILGILFYACSTICLASTAGGDFTINNNSNLDMNRNNMQSKVMKKWDFPQTVTAHQSTQSRVEFIVPWLGIPGDDYGMVSYQITCPAGSQTIGFHTVVDWKLTNVRSNPLFEANFAVQSSGANCVSMQPASGGTIAFQQNGRNVLTIFNNN
jgi:hypothetical protein